MKTFFSQPITLYNLTLLAFPSGVDFPDETGKMSRSDKRGTLRGESGGVAVDRGRQLRIEVVNLK